MEPVRWSREFGLQLRMHRVALGITLRRGAEALGMTMTLLSAIESGSHLTNVHELNAWVAALRRVSGGAK